ncbi:hypothetical protein [Psychromonas sp.]|uniref:hypothetical protein n=1 Tax=Psychromonas sp. TaxID=1884585 RepID=UPI0039E30061
MSEHFSFYENSCLVGYCCINGEGYILQFYLSPVAKTKAAELFPVTELNGTSLFRIPQSSHLFKVLRLPASPR